ncbi:MAG: O-antigen ligase family protein, partial [Patescibacteria group bacterium]
GLLFYLPSQIALNLANGIDLMSGRALIMIFAGVYFIKKMNPTPPRQGGAGYLGGYFLRGVPPWRDKYQIPPFHPCGKPPGIQGNKIKNERIFLRESLKKYAAPLLFLIVAAASLLVAENQFWGGRKLLLFLTVFPIYFVARELLGSSLKKGQVIFWLSSGASLAALVALGQFLAQFIFGLEETVKWWSEFIAPHFFGASFAKLVAINSSWLVAVSGQNWLRAFGFFPDPHMLSFCLGLTAPLLAAALVVRKKTTLVGWFFLGLILLALFLTFSRGGYLGIMAALGVFLLVGWPRLERKLKKIIFTALGLLIVLMIIWGAPVANRFVSSFDLNEGSALGRWQIWQESAIIFSHQPILGVGLGNYSLAINWQADYRNAMPSHNLYLDLLVETGV